MLRFTIIDQFGHSRHIDEPVGWDAISFHYIRHKDWHGFIDTVDDTMGSLQFYGSGRDILIAAFESYGVEAQCGFMVEFQCSDTDSWESIYQGQFSFYKYKEVQGLNGCHVECSIESVTNVMTLRSRYEQKVDLNSLVPFQTPASPHTTGLNQIQAISTTQLYPPDPGTSTVNTGDAYLVPSPPSGSANLWYGGSPGQIAIRVDGGWTYTSPLAGQVLIDMSTHIAYIYVSGSWVPDTHTLSPYMPALGGEVLLPSKTIRLTTEALVNSGIYMPASGSDTTPTGGSAFTLNNNDQGVQSMQLSWVGGVISEGIPSFSGADPNFWSGHSLGDSSVNADPIFTYSPNADFSAPAVHVDIRISGTITATGAVNDTTHPAMVNAMKVALCRGTGSFNNAYNNGLIDTSHAIALAGGDGYVAADYSWESYTTGPVITFSYSYQGAVPMVTGTNVYLVFEFDFPNRVNADDDPPAHYLSTFAVTYTGSASFSIDSIFPDTAAPVYLINESLSRVAEVITDDQIRVYSDFFGRTDSLPYTTLNTAGHYPAIGNNRDGEGSLLAITNGLLIRGQTLLDGSLPPMPISLKQLFESLNAIYNIGMSTEPDTTPGRSGRNWLRIEPMSYFYKPDVIMTCENVNEVSTEIAAEKYVAIFRTGYNKWQGEQTGGLDDFMTKREYRTALSTSRTVLEKYCGFLGSSYAIETTRRQSGLNTQDWRFDHEDFVICLERPAEFRTATATATAAGFQIVFAITDPGSGYTSPPAVTVHDSGGGVVPGIFGASLTYVLGDSGIYTLSPAGTVAGVYHITDPGYLPSDPMTVTLSAPTAANAGMGAVPLVTVDPSSTAVLTIGVVHGGSGYTIPPLVHIGPPLLSVMGGGIQATAIATVVAGVVTSVQIVEQGYGYSAVSPPLVTFVLPHTQALRVEQFAATTSHNIVDPNTLYNYRISPVRNAMRWVRSIFQSYADWMGGVLHYISGEANIRATGRYAGIIEGGAQIVPVMETAPIAEDADISYASFITPSDYYPLYSHKTVKFTYPMSYAEWKNISAHPYGLIGYTVNDGPAAYGWIEDLKYSPFDGTAEFTLKKKL